MKLKQTVSKATSELPAEGIYSAVAKFFKEKGEKKVQAGFGLRDGSEVTCDFPRDINPGSPLHKCAGTFLGEKLVRTLENGEFDCDKLVGLPCRVLVEHKKASGGKMVATVKAVLPAEQPESDESDTAALNIANEVSAVAAAPAREQVLA
jgi:hypothetical protein